MAATGVVNGTPRVDAVADVVEADELKLTADPVDVPLEHRGLVSMLGMSVCAAASKSSTTR